MDVHTSAPVMARSGTREVRAEGVIAPVCAPFAHE